MAKISVVINLDSRPQNDVADVMFQGTVNTDFLLEGVINKINFFNGFDIEVIAYIDEHNPVPHEIVSQLLGMCDVVSIRKHTNEKSFNDYNYLRALSLATGDIICHVDQDTACFTNSKEYVSELLAHLDNYKFVSYPSHWTPNPVHDDSFGGKFWASTRFFLCRKESLHLNELKKCIEIENYVYDTYGERNRRCDWTEHFLAHINDNSVYYPPVELHKGAIFSWGIYTSGTLHGLNQIPYEGVKQWILHHGGIIYPCDVKC